MRAGISTIQQTLTPEAATVLNHSITEASRRNHGQTTPLHVAATLLASPTGFLRQACIKAHPNSSHPLQCRALELCFNVALERLPTSQNAAPGTEPPISNALMAALKRAQAHQRRGCPEQQQQPLLAVKVELEQLIISILDDPSVSRVMREAGFSSPAVKATIEQSIGSGPSANPSQIGLGFRPAPVSMNRNLYLNPRLQQNGASVVTAQPEQQRSEEVKRVMEILLRAKKRNPVLVGESEPGTVLKELLRKIETRESESMSASFKNVEIIHLEKEFGSDKSQMGAKIVELSGSVTTRLGNSGCGGVIINLGDLKWLVEQQQQIGAAEAGRIAVAEMAKLVVKFGKNGTFWLIGTATCETYLRCQVYHPSMENDWDLQAVPVAARTPLTGMFSRSGNNGMMNNNSVDSPSRMKNFPVSVTPQRSSVYENSLDSTRTTTKCCPVCTQSYQQELSILERSSSNSKTETSRAQLPQWLQNAKASDTDQTSSTKDQELVSKQKSEELRKKWSDTCLRSHPSYHRPSLGSERMTNLPNPKLILHQPFQPKFHLNKNLGEKLKINSNLLASQVREKGGSPPRSPVRTDLVLGRLKPTLEKKQEILVENLLGRLVGHEAKIQETRVSEPETNTNTFDIDAFKRLLKGLTEKVWWQHDASSAIAATVSQCKYGDGKRRGTASKSDIWLLFTGPDRVGKTKMALALSDLLCGVKPIIISLGSRRDDNTESDYGFRGKTVLDRIAETVRRNPFSVIMLEDIDETNTLIRGNIKRAMECGRISDSHGREISLGNVIFILTENRTSPSNNKFIDEKKLEDLVSGSWQLRLSIRERTCKRRPSWLFSDERSIKPRKEIPFDLNETATEAEDIDKTDGSHNSSDLTDENGLSNRSLTKTSLSRDFLSSVDDTISFKPVDFAPIKRNVEDFITRKFSTIIGDGLPIEFEDDAIEKIAGGVWLGHKGLEEWIEKVFVPSLNQLRSRLHEITSEEESVVARLEIDNEDGGCERSPVDLLPSLIKVVLS